MIEILLIALVIVVSYYGIGFLAMKWDTPRTIWCRTYTQEGEYYRHGQKYTFHAGDIDRYAVHDDLLLMVLFWWWLMPKRVIEKSVTKSLNKVDPRVAEHKEKEIAKQRKAIEESIHKLELEEEKARQRQRELLND